MKEQLLKTELSLLLQKRKNIKQYNLSGTAWQWENTTKERDELLSKAKKSDNKAAEIEAKIVKTIKQLLSLSYSIEDIIKEFPEVKAFITDEKFTNANNKKI